MTRAEVAVFRGTARNCVVPRYFTLIYAHGPSGAMQTKSRGISRDSNNTSASRRLHLLLLCTFTFTRGVSKYGSSAVSYFRR